MVVHTKDEKKEARIYKKYLPLRQKWKLLPAVKVNNSVP